MITLRKNISSAPVLFFIFKGKKVSFNSFMVKYLSGKEVLAFSKKEVSKGLLEVQIFLARDEPISVNLSAISVSKIISYQQ